MATNAITFDVVALAEAWARAYPGLVGRGGAIGGVFLVPPRSPARGVWCIVKLADGGTVDVEGAGHTARVSWEVRAKGGEAGAKHEAFDAARQLADALRSMDGRMQVVTAKSGETATLRNCANTVGPSDAGEPNGIATYRVDTDFVFLAV